MASRAGNGSTMFKLLAAACFVPTAFFVFYGVQLMHAAITFDGEGSLGHVGMYIGAILFPLLALLFGGCTMIAWRKSRPDAERRPPPTTPR